MELCLHLGSSLALHLPANYGTHLPACKLQPAATYPTQGHCVTFTNALVTMASALAFRSDVSVLVVQLGQLLALCPHPMILPADS